MSDFVAIVEEEEEEDFIFHNTCTNIYAHMFKCNVEGCQKSLSHPISK